MKRSVFLLCVLTGILAMGCLSMKAAVPPNPQAAEYRELQNDLQKHQADMGITGVRIEEESRGIALDIAKLEDSIANAPPDFGEAERLNWLYQVQELQIQADNHQENIEHLNRQLVEERETTNMLTRKFNDYETVQIETFSNKDTEIALLQKENKAVEGQRNTLSAVVITAVVVVTLFVMFNGLRAMKTIPF
jgi:predicted RNase H-like nuclease (RuvC/YqgF family)